MDDSQKFLAIAAKIRTLEKRLNETRQEVVKVEKQVGPSGPPGRDGKDGINGIDGRNGIDGKDGRDGQDGKDGISVTDASIDFDNSLVLKLSDGTEIDAGQIKVSIPDQINVFNATSAGGGGGVSEVYAVRYDEVTSSLIYRGEASAGSLEASAVWRIQKIVISGEDITITWADGNTNFDNAWTDHLSLSYS